MKFSKVHSILLIAALLLGGIVFSSILHPVSAQTAQPTVTSTPDIVPTLQAVIATQQVRIQELERELAFESKNREIEFRNVDSLFLKINSQWESWLAVIGIVSVIFGIAGFTGWRDVLNRINQARQDWKENVAQLEKQWEKKSQLMLDQAIFQFNPSNLPVWLPNDAVKIHQLLTHRSLGKVEFYDDYEKLNDDQLLGIIVISMLDENKAQLSVTEEKFRNFLKNRKLDPATTGIVIYTGANQISKDIMPSFDNLVTANYHAKVVSGILEVGRGLKISAPEKSE